MRQYYLTGLLTKLPGEHIPLLSSFCLVSKPVAEAFVIVLALLNPATADPIRRCLCSPLVRLVRLIRLVILVRLVRLVRFSKIGKIFKIGKIW